MLTRVTGILLAALVTSVQAQGRCRPKSIGELRQKLINDELCPELPSILTYTDISSNRCKCTTHQQPVYMCPAEEGAEEINSQTMWKSKGKRCIKANVLKFVQNFTRHDWDYPAEHMTYCPPVVYGAGTDTRYTSWINPGTAECVHLLDKDAIVIPNTWKPGNPGYNKNMDSALWCHQPGCFVDPCTCNQPDLAVSTEFKRADGGPVYFSNNQCGGTNLYTSAYCARILLDTTCDADPACAWDKPLSDICPTCIKKVQASGAEGFASPLFAALVTVLGTLCLSA